MAEAFPLTAMSGDWTYNGQPDTIPLDEVRIEIGDVDPTDPQLRDTEVNHYINVYGNRGNAAIYAAIACCHVLAAKYARKANKAIGKLRIDMSDIAKSYRDQAMALRSRSGVTVQPYAGGVEISDKNAYLQNTSLTQPFFTRSMMSVNQDETERPILPD
jgi:hypothetical protein